MKTSLLLTTFCLAGFCAPTSAPGITWEASFEEALARAEGNGLVTFVAVNMDGERANDRMADSVYTDSRIRKLADSTASMVASNFTHAKGGGVCPRFGSVTCAEHRRVDVEVRGKLLEPDEQGFVVAPQHLWLDSKGAVLLSVPYGITTEEMEWCFVTALQAVEPSFEWELSDKARAPRRLVMNGVAKTGKVDAAGGAPLTRKEALEIVEKLKRGARGEEANQMVKRLAQADEPEARDYMVTYLRASATGGGRRGGGAGNADKPDRRVKLLHWIGSVSPPSYWEVCVEFLSASNTELRAEAVVALEQLAAPESVRALRSAVKKEKDPRIRKNIFRALGTAGGADRKAVKLLLKQAGDKRNELWRRNAILALGSLAPNDDVKELLTSLVSDSESPEAEAALVAVALTRDAEWLELLEGLLEGATEQSSFAETLKAAISVLKGGPITDIRKPLKTLGEDEIARERLFGAERGREGREE